MSIDGLQAIVVADDDEVTIAARLIADNANLTAEGGADGVANVDLDVKALVLASPACTEVRRQHAAGRRHVEVAQVDAEGVGQRGLAVSRKVLPVVVQVGSGTAHLLYLYQSA